MASEPTCSGAVPQAQTGPRPQVGGGAANFLIPASSRELPEDRGIRAHTNHIVLIPNNNMRIIGPSGLTPAQVAGAYDVTQAGTGAIAIVDAYNYPSALDDFNTFSTEFGLPTETSSTVTDATNQVLQVVYAGGSKPADDASWSQEMALDIQWAHAMAPNAKIYLVEAASDNFTDIMHAVNVAKALTGVRQVSMSFGGNESGCLYTAFNNYLVRNNVTFFAAAGDIAGGREFPACSYNVVSVGGTSLNVNGIGVWISETAWDSTGCGPSTLEPRPVYQDDLYSTIGRYRGGVDIAAVADPNTGVSVYDSTPYQSQNGWLVIGGTSASTPIVAGIVNSSGIVFRNSQALNAKIYTGVGGANLHDITSGSSGGFNAGAGWDFPSGAGSPNGLATLLGG
ncbi:MAG TPA: S53 family peptidase [Fimbriimonadaceae bacterium]|nr:S53 family peptidase [Fimbriimonadaceae bacterium]